ncbi:uncharacterized protein LOC141679559 [Apium graveolens]|uniref:uncharacterized protein LOC141679559 n=1 Tax=Apium graveolens TaxID=4045 RepID=UPI003D79DBB2
MLADAKAYVKKYDRCKRHAPVVRQPTKRLTSISSPIPFAMWGMDIIGPFPVASGQRKFIVVAIDYFTKWIEVNALAKITHQEDFSIVLGKSDMSIWNVFTCVDELLLIIWAYRTTCKVTTEATPFMLTYGVEAVILLAITRGSPRVEAYEPKTNKKVMRLALDLIDKVRDKANAHNTEHQYIASLYYNRRVNERFYFFQQGNLVLRKIEASGVDEKGKLAPNWEGPYNS